MTSSYRKSTISVLLGLALCGCADSNTAESASAQAREDRTELRRRHQEQKYLERLAQDNPAPVTGEIPDKLLNKVIADLEQRSGGKPSDFDVRRAEAVQWNDGSLGCPEPGQIYQQLPVNGFWIVIDYQGQAFDYRASDRDYFKLCPGLSLRR